MHQTTGSRKIKKRTRHGIFWVSLFLVGTSACQQPVTSVFPPTEPVQTKPPITETFTPQPSATLAETTQPTATETLAPTATETKKPTPTVVKITEQTEIKNSLGIDLHNLAGAPGVTGEIAALYPTVQYEIENAFPTDGVLMALVTDWIIYNNYDTAPEINGKKLLAEAELSYLDINQQEQTIYYPIELYDPINFILWMVATQANPEILSRLKTYLESKQTTRLAHYYEALARFLLPGQNDMQLEFNENMTGWFVNLDTIWPLDNAGSNRNSDYDFNLLESDNPPYTQEDLANFRATGDPKYLPEINGKRYLWPCANFQASLFNLQEKQIDWRDKFGK